MSLLYTIFDCLQTPVALSLADSWKIWFLYGLLLFISPVITYAMDLCSSGERSEGNVVRCILEAE
jgi:hypothetical protein